MEYDDDSWGPSILLQYYEIELDCSNFYDGLSFQVHINTIENEGESEWLKHSYLYHSLMTETRDN